MSAGPDLARDRHIPLEGASNLRDVGGYATADGRRVRWSLVYRSGALSGLTPVDWQWMVEHEIRSVCDLRSDQERQLAPTLWGGRADTMHIGDVYPAQLIFAALSPRAETARVNEMAHSHYALFPRLLAPSYRQMFEALLDGATPLIVHCSAGQDRTGLAIGLLLTALGVPQATIVDDYLLSTELRRVENELDHERLAQLAGDNMVARFYADRIGQLGASAMRARPLLNQAGEAVLLDGFSAIAREWGSIETYLEEMLGLRANRIEALRDICLELT